MSAYADANIAERQSSNATDCSVLELVIGKIRYLVLALLGYLGVTYQLVEPASLSTQASEKSSAIHCSKPPKN